MRPHRRQPTRLPRPLDSPGKNTGVGCHFLLQCMKVKSESEGTQLCLTISDPMTAAHQAPPYMGFSRQEYWSGVPLPSPASILSPIKWDRLRGFCDWKFAHFSFHYFSLHILVVKVLSIYRVRIVVTFCNFECFIPMKCFSLPQVLLTQDLFGCHWNSCIAFFS